jgi:hypothetical protein
LPTVIVCTTWFVVGSMRETVPSRPFATQTAPPPAATPAGPPPTWIVCRTLLVDGSMREIELSFEFVTQTASGPAATSPGAPPTSISETISPFFESITPTAFGPTEVLAGDPRLRITSTPKAAMRATPASAAAVMTRPLRGGQRIVSQPAVSADSASRVTVSTAPVRSCGARVVATFPDTPASERADARPSVGDDVRRLR